MPLSFDYLEKLLQMQLLLYSLDLINRNLLQGDLRTDINNILLTKEQKSWEI